MEKEWLTQLMEELAHHVHSYEEKALLAQAEELLREQANRIEQLQGEIDGRLWNHKEW